MEAESIQDSEPRPVLLKCMEEGRSVVGDEVGEQGGGHINICPHPRRRYIHFNYSSKCW